MLLSRRSPSLLLVPTGSPPSCRLRCAVRALALPSSRPAALLLAMPLARFLPHSSELTCVPAAARRRCDGAPHQGPVARGEAACSETGTDTLPSPLPLLVCPLTRGPLWWSARGRCLWPAVSSCPAHDPLSLLTRSPRALSLARSLSLSLSHSPPPPPTSPTPSLSLSDPSHDLRHLR